LSEPLSLIVQVAEAVSWRSLESSGRMVRRSTAPAMPIAARRASPVLSTTPEPISSEGNWSNSMPRLLPAEMTSRPLSRARLKSRPKPRIEICCERPRTRWAVTPGRRASVSAIDRSGSRPMSSAVGLA
jgi:hypothetical protein